MDAIYKAQDKRFKLEVFVDEDAYNANPRDYDNVGTFITWDRGYNSPDPNEYSSPDDFLLAWRGGWSVMDETGETFGDVYDTEDEAREDIYWYEEGRGIMPDMGTAGRVPGIGAGGFMLPVFKFEHSGVAYNTGGFNDPWDSGQVGFIYMTAETVAKEYAQSETYPTAESWALACLKGEVSEYSSWASGEVYGYVLSEWVGNYGGEDTYREVDSCWGFIGDPKESMPGNFGEADYLVSELS